MSHQLPYSDSKWVFGIVKKKYEKNLNNCLIVSPTKIKSIGSILEV